METRKGGYMIGFLFEWIGIAAIIIYIFKPRKDDDEFDDKFSGYGD